MAKLALINREQKRRETVKKILRQAGRTDRRRSKITQISDEER